jgi:hypothetical protein
MRLLRISICFMILGVLAAGTFGQVPLDPKVIVNLNDPVCSGSPTLICYTGSSGDPLVESYTNPLPFVYQDPTHTTPLTELFIDLINVPADTAFQCQTNIWTDCTITPDKYGVATVGFDLFGAGPNDFGGGTCNPCVGQLTDGQGGTFDIMPLVNETPEPASMVLFGTGLCSILFAAKRRLTAPTST